MIKYSNKKIKSHLVLKIRSSKKMRVAVFLESDYDLTVIKSVYLLAGGPWPWVSLSNVDGFLFSVKHVVFVYQDMPES